MRKEENGHRNNNDVCNLRDSHSTGPYRPEVEGLKEMGRFKAEAIIVRKLSNGITIIFWDRSSIYVYAPDSAQIFHRWFAQEGSYGEYWQDFRRKMLRTKFKSILQIYELAATYDVQSCRTDRKLNLEGRKTKILTE